MTHCCEKDAANDRAMFRDARYSMSLPATLSYASGAFTYLRDGNRVMGKVIGLAVALALLANVSLADPPHHRHHHHSHHSHHHHPRPH
jgi:hypothetical protein